MIQITTFWIFLCIDTHFLQGVAQTQDLLQAVWHQNYHGFSDYIHDEPSLNPHVMIQSSHFHPLTDSSINRANSIWNYHQKLMQDSLNTFRVPNQWRPVMSTTSRKPFQNENCVGNDRFDFDCQKNMINHPNFKDVGFPALLHEQNVPSSRMPPPFPHSFGNLIHFLIHWPIHPLNGWIF